MRECGLEFNLQAVARLGTLKRELQLLRFRIIPSIDTRGEAVKLERQ